MIRAKVKYPYKKDWEKDIGYGQSAPITFESDIIGEYKQYVSSTDFKKQWLRELEKGDEVVLEANPNGAGYIVKQLAFESQSTDEQIKNSARVLGECIREIEEQLKYTTTAFSSEDIRSFAISLFIRHANKQ